VAMKALNAPLGIGVGEDTALYVITENGTSEAIALGNGGAWIIDSSSAKFPNEYYFTATDLSINYLTENDSYDYSSKRVFSASPPISTTTGRPQASNNVFGPDEAIKTILSLGQSTQTYLDNLSQESGPRAAVNFRKSGSTSVYYSSSTRFTVSNLLVDIMEQRLV